MALRDVELEVAKLLEAAGLGSMSSNPPTLYAGPFPAGSPDVVLSVVDFGSGENAEPHLGGAGRVSLTAEVTVRVRGEKHRYAEARGKALEAWAACWEGRPASSLHVVPSGSGPTYLGPDPSGRHQFSFTVRVRYRASSSAGSLTPDT